MKKTVITLAVVAFAAAAVQATTTSANVVGYAKVTANKGALTFTAINFDTGSETYAGLYDALPNNSTLYVWDKDNNQYVSANKGFFGWSGAAATRTVANGDALWISIPDSATEASYDIIYPGEVNVAATNTVTLDAIDAVGLGYPVEVTFGSTDLYANAPNDTTLYLWNGSAYTPYNKGFFGWSSGAETAVIGPTTAFWVNVPSSFSWEESRPFNY